MTNPTIWTIGHSTHPFDYFVDELKSFDIRMLVDVRSLPGSNKFPHFNKEYIEEHLPSYGINYMRIEDLGGRRKNNPNSPHTVWRHPAFRAYADYMDTESFKDGIEKLKKIALQERTAIMCAEAVWWRCHRSMISDYMKSIGWTVINITAVGKSKEHPYTGAAHIVDGKLYYGPQIIDE